MTAESVEAVMRKFQKAILGRALGAEMTHHLSYELGGEQPARTANHRNGSSGKTVLTDDGPLRVEVPRDRHGVFEPQIVGKHERRFTGFDDKIIALYACALTVRVQAHLREMYAVDVSPDLISSVSRAEPAPGADISGGVLRRVAGQDPRGRRGA